MTPLGRRISTQADSAGALADPAPASRQDAVPPPLLHAVSVRTLIISGGLLVAVWIAQQALALPPAVELLRKLIALVVIVSAAWSAALVVSRNLRDLLWRVRRKLILSYLFLSVVPIVLVLAFALVGGVLFYDNLAAYLFRQGLEDVIDDVHSIAETAAVEIGRTPGAAPTILSDRYANWSSHYPRLSLAVVPAGGGTGGRALSAGPWDHVDVPAAVPSWVIAARGFTGSIARSGVEAGEHGSTLEPLIRAVVATPNGRAVVIVDLPLDTAVAARIEERAGTRIEGFFESNLKALPVNGLFQEAIARIDVATWASGDTHELAVRLEAPFNRLSKRIAAVQSAQLASTGNRGLVTILIVFGVLFAIIQGSAVVMGGALARSITQAVHELFVGTERVRQGDFAHRIRVDSQDQLGDLAGSFNRMSASIEHLLHVQREKQRLDDELRIAREIQQSLLPVRPPQLAGLSIADLCEPAREVGGDYYDFFDLGPRQLGVLIADVSGKGTSAALYMAELKGLMLALSHSERSPRTLLVKVNHLLAEHLDNRSFITATYVVIDLDAKTLTYARAGHTPLIVASGGQSDVLVPDGMVLGLRLPGASERFDTLLEEQTRTLSPGDVIVLYTDGITEAMDVDGELFGDAALGRILADSTRPGASGEPCGPGDAAAIREKVIREITAFVGGAEPHDDMTMVVIKIHDA